MSGYQDSGRAIRLESVTHMRLLVNRRLLAFCLSVIVMLWSSSAFADESVGRTTVFQAGADGYAVYRIPAIVRAKDGTVLAFAEGRRNGKGDAGEINLVLKRSTDDGHTFGPMQVMWADGPNTCGNPCPVVDEETGTVFLFSTYNLGDDHEKDIAARKSK